MGRKDQLNWLIGIPRCGMRYMVSFLVLHFCNDIVIDNYGALAVTRANLKKKYFAFDIALSLSYHSQTDGGRFIVRFTVVSYV